MNTDIIKSESQKKSSGDSMSRMLKSVTIGVIINIFSAVVLFLIFSLIINKFFADPDSVIKIFIIIAACVSVFAGAMFAAFKNGSKGLFTGFLTGAVTSIIIFIVMLFAGSGGNNARNGDTDYIFRVIIIICQLLVGCVSGIFAVNSSGKQRYQPHKYRKSTKK